MGNVSLPRDVLPHQSRNGLGAVRLRFHGGAESLPTSDWSIYVDDEVVFTGSIDKCRDWLDLYEFNSRAYMAETAKASDFSHGVKRNYAWRIAEWFYKFFGK